MSYLKEKADLQQTVMAREPNMRSTVDEAMSKCTAKATQRTAGASTGEDIDDEGMVKAESIPPTEAQDTQEPAIDKIEEAHLSETRIALQKFDKERIAPVRKQQALQAQFDKIQQDYELLEYPMSVPPFNWEATENVIRRYFDSLVEGCEHVDSTTYTLSSSTTAWQWDEEVFDERRRFFEHLYYCGLADLEELRVAILQLENGNCYQSEDIADDYREFSRKTCYCHKDEMTMDDVCESP